MLICMQSTSVRIDVSTHDELKRLAAELHTTVGHAVTLAVRALRQDRVGAELTQSLRDDEVAWLDAELGDVVDVDLGSPQGREAGFVHPAVVVTAQRILDASPSVLQVVPLTSTIRQFHSEITIEPDDANGLTHTSAAQCQHLRAVSPSRLAPARGNVGPALLAQLRETIAVLLDLTD